MVLTCLPLYVSTCPPACLPTCLSASACMGVSHLPRMFVFENIPAWRVPGKIESHGVVPIPAGCVWQDRNTRPREQRCFFVKNSWRNASRHAQPSFSKFDVCCSVHNSRCRTTTTTTKGTSTKAKTINLTKKGNEKHSGQVCTKQGTPSALP